MSQNKPASGNEVIDDMRKLESNILVAIRLRPMLSKEIMEGQFNLVKIMDDKLVILQDP